jgi:hypothetical protein
MKITRYMETILTIINPFFVSNQWQLQQKDNTLCYQYNKDEFVITLLPKTNEIEITIPLNEVRYKNKFKGVTTAIDYIKMHLDYYHLR